jgi:hypothetical protein
MGKQALGRCATRRSAALRAEPVALSQAKPAAAIALAHRRGPTGSRPRGPTGEAGAPNLSTPLQECW